LDVRSESLDELALARGERVLELLLFKLLLRLALAAPAAVLLLDVSDQLGAAMER
jgi:hypothetical protein